MKSFLSLVIFLLAPTHAQNNEEAGPFKTLSVLNETSLYIKAPDNSIVRAFDHDEKIPPRMKFIVDTNSKNAPEGQYKVYLSPEASESTLNFFNTNAKFGPEYEKHPQTIPEDCTPTDENPYKCLKHFFINKQDLGVAPTLDSVVAEMATNINDIVISATTPQCDDCPVRPQMRPHDLNTLTSDVRPYARPDRDCSIEIAGEMVNCNSRDKRMNTWVDTQKMICLYENSRADICPNLKRIDIIADIMGLDRRQMACMVLIESEFKGSVCSGANACGITQVQPATAREMAQSTKVDYRDEWNEFQRRVGGTPFPVSSVSSGNIRAGHPSYGLFGMAVRLKNLIRMRSGRNLESTWRDFILGGGEPRYYFHTQIAGYNWGPARVDNITNSVMNGGSPYTFSSSSTGRTPLETRKFMEKFNQCMYKSNPPWRYISDPNNSRIASRGRKCNLNNNQPVCEGLTE